MRWGVRKTDPKNNQTSKKKEKLHLGLDKRGNINLIRGTTTADAKKAFATKSLMFAASIAVTAYLIKHPRAVMNGQEKVKSILSSSGKKAVKDVGPTMSGIYSKKLGRELTFMEAFDSGYDMSD